MNCDHVDPKTLKRRFTWIEYDARNIPLGTCCEICQTDLLSKFRTEVLTNPNYECDEQIEPEPEF